MNSLMSYGSDDNSEDSGDQKFPEMPGSMGGSSRNYKKPASHEDNYEEVGMDMSEDSNESNGPESKSKPAISSSTTHRQTSRNKSGSRSPKYKRDEEERRNSRNEERSRDDRYKKRDERNNRDDDKGRDRYREDRRDRNSRYSRDRRDRKRSRSRDRRRSKSPRRPSRSPKRSRSGSRDRGSRGFPSRREKADKRMDRLDKLGIEFKPHNYPASAIEEAERNSKTNPSGDRFFMPGITGRFREQIEKRKLLWQKAKEPDNTEKTPAPITTNSSNLAAAGGSKSTKVYEATTFADDKTSNKFKRLMGIKGTDTSALPVKSTDVLKKQQEMFSSMEAQYEVARTATHTMRGVGLGFGSFQR